MGGLYGRCNFTKANLIGADFSKARFKEGCIFHGAQADETTRFDGAQALRPYLKQDVFRFYRIERGVLVRKDAQDVVERVEVANLNAMAALDEGIRLISALPEPKNLDGNAPSIGHNCPPVEFELTAEEKEEAINCFSEARETLNAGENDPSKVKMAIAKAAALSSKALTWIGGHADTAVGEYAREFGKTLGGKTAAVISVAYFSGAMNEILELLAAVVG